MRGSAHRSAHVCAGCRCSHSPRSSCWLRSFLLLFARPPKELPQRTCARPHRPTSTSSGSKLQVQRLAAEIPMENPYCSCSPLPPPSGPWAFRPLNQHTSLCVCVLRELAQKSTQGPPGWRGVAASRRRECHLMTPTVYPFETPNKGRGGCDQMTVSAAAQRGSIEFGSDGRELIWSWASVHHDGISHKIHDHPSVLR